MALFLPSLGISTLSLSLTKNQTNRPTNATTKQKRPIKSWLQLAWRRAAPSHYCSGYIDGLPSSLHSFVFFFFPPFWLTYRERERQGSRRANPSIPPRVCIAIWRHSRLKLHPKIGSPCSGNETKSPVIFIFYFFWYCHLTSHEFKWELFKELVSIICWTFVTYRIEKKNKTRNERKRNWGRHLEKKKPSEIVSDVESVVEKGNGNKKRAKLFNKRQKIKIEKKKKKEL